VVKRLAVFAFGVAIGVVVWLGMRPQTPEGQPSPAVSALSVEARASATPSIAADGRVVSIAWGGTSSSGAADVFAAVSTDGGRSFAPPVRVNDEEGTARVSGEMAPRVAVRAREGQPAVVHVLWTAQGDDTTIRLARSEDGGRTYGPSQGLQAAGAAGDRGWAGLAADRDGRVRAVWLDHRGMAAGATATGVRLTADTAHHHGHDTAGSNPPSDEGVEIALKSVIYYSDGMVERALAQGVCYCCKTAVVTGGDGQVFIAWRHVYPGNMRDIAVASSRNDGVTFSAPVRVSQDQWQIDGCPDDGPAMALGMDATVHLVWPTVVSQPEPHKAMFYATSRDGLRFTPRVRVSPVGHNIAHPQIAVGVDGQVVVVWDQIVQGKRRVFLSRLRDGAFAEGETLSEDASASYPVAAFSDGALVVVWTEGTPEASRIAIRRIARR